MLKLKILRHTLAIAALLALVFAPAVWANDSLNQGLSHFRSGKYAEAAAEFQTLVDGSPAYDYGYFMLGLSLLKMGKFKEAEDNIVKAIELNGDSVFNQIWMAMGQSQLGNTAEAKKWLQHARDQHQPEFLSPAQWRVQLLQRMLLEEAETLVETDPNAA